MSTITLRIWRRMNGRRVAAIAFALSLLALGLFFYLVSRGVGDSDLPPYTPDTTAERIGVVISAVVLWPLAVTGLLLGHDPHRVLWLPLSFLGGLFWAVIIELILIAKNARRV